MKYHLTSQRLGFGFWSAQDLPQAQALWGNSEVCAYINHQGAFQQSEIQQRLVEEIRHQNTYGVQYWPLFNLSSHEFIGCCGLRMRRVEPDQPELQLELGVHLLPAFWRQGFAMEACKQVIEFAKTASHGDYDCLLAGHHPDNHSSKKLLTALGFQPRGEVFYAPTGLMHPVYDLNLS